jgi:hypothetical protein
MIGGRLDDIICKMCYLLFCAEEVLQTLELTLTRVSIRLAFEQTMHSSGVVSVVSAARLCGSTE